MPKKPDIPEIQDASLLILEAKREAIFESMQNMFDLSGNINSSAEAKESFLGECSNVDTQRDEFKTILDEYNSRLLTLDPTAKPDYKSLVAFESLYSRIKRLQRQYDEVKPSSHNVVDVAAPSKGRPTLPPIELMSFSGDIRSWPLFYASFKTTVHDNPSLTDAEKLYYLLGKLSDRAQSVCAGITPCAENYQLIMQALIDKYEDKRSLASAYINQMFEFKALNTATANNLELFIDKFISAVRALKNLKLENLVDMILLHIALKKLDSDTVRAFELNTISKIPTFEELVEFIKNRTKVFERMDAGSSSNYTHSRNSTHRHSNNNKGNSNTNNPPPKYQSYLSTTADSSSKCLCTNITHQHLFKCPTFNKLTPEERYKCVREKNACINCLSVKHRVSTCSSNVNCRLCRSKHHTLLHFKRDADVMPHRAPPPAPASAATEREDAARAAAPAPPPPPASASGSRSDVALCATSETSLATQLSECCTVLLATAQVTAYSDTGERHTIRVLLDSASQSHFITKECCKILGVQVRDIECVTVKGFGGNEKLIKSGSVNFEFFSRFDENIKFNIAPLVVDRITDSLPTAVVDTSAMSHLFDLPLADESFGIPNKVDALIGAPLFAHLLLPDVVRKSRDPSAPSALRTVLGYVIMGSVPTPSVRQSLMCCLVQEPIDNFIKRFWELEEPPTPSSVQHPADAECEEFYESTTTRDPVSGRYIVRLPFRDDVFSLGDSYKNAHRRFVCLERKLESSLKLRKAYDDVIKDYIANDYVSPAPPRDPHDTTPIYVIPHHGVIREDKTTTRLRIVLDASCKTTSGRSLNDILHAGPNLQGDLFQIILNFRLHAVAMTADCRQQFLQIMLHEDDRRYQCFLYRFGPRDPLVLYRFNRVCFGLSSSPYHALRTVQQLIEDDGHKYPLASGVASDSLYMDDIVFSVITEEEGIAAAKQLIDLFKGAQWDLVKWNSNSKAVLAALPASHKLPTEVEFDKAMRQKILGLHWSTDTDVFYFKISPPTEKGCTKRCILSTIARLWDIMGFVAPTVLYAKLLIKQLWQLDIGWDDQPPPRIIKLWSQFCSELPALNEISIPRHLGVSKSCTVTLLGFSDASEQAYGGVVYLRVSSGNDSSVRLVCAKSKVAPTKAPSIARLELCGAVLLSKLLRNVLNNYSRHFHLDVYAFTDSKVALYWIRSPPHRWQTFVANRVVQVTENIPADKFYHVSGSENPADCLSRGTTPEKLVSHPLWFHGPSWAILDPSEWPIREIDEQPVDDMPERKTYAHNTCTPIEQRPLYDLGLRTSSWSKLLRIIVYVNRFAKISPRRSTIAVTAEDLEIAEIRLMVALQNKYFAEEFLKIEKGEDPSPAFVKLKAFIDNGVIRVGGRLTNAGLDYTRQHPVILPKNDPIVNLLIDYYHVKYLHAGPELLMSLLRQRFWILSARRVVRKRIHMCNTCFRHRPRPTYPLMADLPESRTRQVVKAFTHTGCDYAGPIAYTPVRRRGVRSEKSYLCIFTCLTTRALHIEVATDLSTPSFLAALKRFLARRGPVQYVYSDNGTNFKGAHSYLRDLYHFLNDEYRSKLEQEFAESRISWKFICPSAPHFGGAWESMVKVVKAHLFRVIGQQLLSYEELITVVTQVECLINSRPLTVLSSDPAEPSALTPSHFLHTSPLCSLPAPEVEADNRSLLDRYSLLDKLVQSFWSRWRREYLHGLQIRQKWNTTSVPIAPGTVVVVINDNAPPLAWPLAIVEKVHPSKDGIIRVATVRTAKGTYQRPVVRLCPLPNQ